MHRHWSLLTGVVLLYCLAMICGCGGGGGGTTPATNGTSVKLTSNVSQITYEGEEIRLAWASHNATRVVSSNFGATAVTDSKTFKPSVTTTYTITVEGPEGLATDSITIPVNYQTNVRLTVDNSIIAPGGTTTLRWSSTAATEVLSSNFGATTVTGALVVSPAQSTTYGIRVRGPHGEATSNVKLDVVPLPTVRITATPNPAKEGEAVTLQWSTTYATRVVRSNFGATSLSGSTIVRPSVGKTVYTMEVAGASGQTTGEVEVVVKPKPVITLTADATSLTYGDKTVLRWNVLHADSIQTNFGTNALSGVLELTPQKSTTYSIKGVGPGGETTATVKVTVRPVVTLTASKSLINPNESVTLAWTSSPNVTQVASSNFGAASPSGTLNHTPPETMTYTITVSDGESTATASVRVEVMGNIDVIVK